MDASLAQKSGSPTGEPAPQHGLPFTYLPKKVVREAVGGISNSSLAEKVAKGIIPPPDKIGSRALWRSDVIAKWLTEQAQKAEAEREERAKAARYHAQRMVDARAKRQTGDAEREESAKTGRGQAQRLVKARQSPSAPAQAE